MAGLGVVAAAGLLLPWAHTGTRTRSSIDLLSSLSALELVAGWQRVAMLVGWFGVILGAAAGLVLVAWDRPRGGALATAVVGPALGVALAAVAASPFAVAWGAWFASGLGATASIGSGLILLTSASDGKDRRHELG